MLCEWVYQTVASVQYGMEFYIINANSTDIFFFYQKKGGIDFCDRNLRQ